jgi:hypothetical protein
LQLFSPHVQADYLVKAMSEALACGSGKVFWTHLRDEPATDASLPTLGGNGLLRLDGTPRLSYQAYKTLTSELSGKKFNGTLQLSHSLIALLFTGQDSSVLVAWSPSGTGSLMLASSGVNPHSTTATFLSTRPDSQVLDATGKKVSGPDGLVKLTQAPFFITHVAFESVRAAAATLNGKPLELAKSGPDYAGVAQVKASFAKSGGEDGLYWRKYADFGGVAVRDVIRDNRMGLVTEAQRDIFDLLSARPYIYLDVADDFMYFANGTPVKVTVDVFRPAVTGPADPSDATSAGFRLEYSAPGGFKSTARQAVAPGQGWSTYSFNLPDASFDNADGYDLLINTDGSRSDLLFGSVTVTRLPKSAPTQLAANPGEQKTTGPAATAQAPVAAP